MPYRKRYRGGFRKKRYGKRFMRRNFKRRGAFKNRRAALSYMGPGQAPLPDKYFTKVRYSNWISNPSGGITGVFDNVFRANNVYDPDFTGTGIGVSGFTELASIYSRYRVYASKIRVSIKSLSDTSSTGDGVILLVPDRSFTGYSMATMINRQAIPFAVTGQMNRGVNGNNPLVLKSFRKTKNIYGETDIDDDAYTGTTAGTAPTSEWYWHIVVGRSDQSSISAYPGYEVLVKISYYVRFELRKALTAP